MSFEIYHTRWNGDCPYEVAFSENDVIIKRRDKNTYGATAIYSGEPILEIKNYVKKYIGMDNGNTILIETKPKNYVYVGDAVYEFTVTDNISEYVSFTGNSDVPYPYAKGDVNTYIMLESSYIPNNLLIHNDPYKQFYETHPRNHPSEQVYNMLKQNNYTIRKNANIQQFYKDNFPMICNVISKYNYRDFNK